MKIPYQKEIIQLQFPGVSGKQFYKLIKQRAIKWEKLPNPIFSRLDVVYQRISKSNDLVSTIDFINSCYIQFQELHSSKNLLSERNQKGLILKIGNRRSSKHYRIYTNKKNNLLRFEAEMKGDLIKDLKVHFRIRQSKQSVALLPRKGNVPKIVYCLKLRQFQIDGEPVDIPKVSRQKPTFSRREGPVTVYFDRIEDVQELCALRAKQTTSASSRVFPAPSTRDHPSGSAQTVPFSPFGYTPT